MNDPSCFYINQLISNVIGWLFVALGWYIAHSYSAKRDQSNHKRKQLTDFLVGAFVQLANAANRPDDQGAENLKAIENAITVIQLFGSNQQVKLAKEFVNKAKKNCQVSLDPLLNSLRDDLRDELSLERIEGEVELVRYQYSDGKAKDPT